MQAREDLNSYGPCPFNHPTIAGSRISQFLFSCPLMRKMKTKVDKCGHHPFLHAWISDPTRKKLVIIHERWIDQLAPTTNHHYLSNRPQL